MADKLKLARDLGHPVSDLNVGGGLGIRYVESDAPPSIEQWIQVVSEAVTSACQERGLELPRLMCEPGRSLVATAGVTLYSCLLYTSPSPRDGLLSRMPSSA